MNSVVSAAIIEGNLIIGLSDGSIINCGFVQGPQGLSGPQGPMGATGDNGTDGNTILTVGGTPGNEMGSDGDYAIDNINWRIYGPKSGGVWGKAKSMLPDAESMITNGRMPGTGSGGGSMGGSGSGSGGGPVFTNTVQLTAGTRTRLTNKTGYRVLPLPGAGKINQEDANRWAFGQVFDRIDETIPVKIASGTPTAEYVGQLYFDTTSSTLFLWDGTLWNPIGGGSNSIGGGISAGDTVNGLWSFTTNTVQPGEWRFIDGSNAYDGGIQIEISNTDSQSDSYPIEYFKIGSQLQLRNVDQTGEFLNTGELNGVLTAVIFDSPDTYRLTYTIEGATGTAIDFARVRVAIAITVEDLDDRYVNEKGGDTMEGQLIINGPRKAGDDVDNPNLVSSLKVLSIDNAQNSSLQLRHSGNAKVYIGDTDISIASNIKFNRAAGSVVKSNVQDLLNISSEEIAYLGRSIEDEDLITKKYVDDTKEFLQNEIIELEEEIDAIAPSTERGTWAYNPVGNVSLPGAYTMYTDTRDEGLGGVASIFAAVKNIALNERDLNNTMHSFGGTEPGDLLEVFEEGDSDYGLYSIISIEKISSPNPGGISYTYISIDVDLERTGNGDMADGRARFKVFKAPSGGDASGFVLKTGDEMSGNLTIDKSEASTNIEAGLKLKGSRGNTTNSAATITFDNAQSTAKGYLTYRSYGAGSWFAFNRDLDLNNNGLHTVARIRMEPNGGIGSGNNTRLTFHNASNGQEGEGLLVVPRPSSDRRGFVIRGNNADGDEGDMFYTYTNYSGTPDAANYVGKIDSPKNLVNKAYVDNALDFSKYPELS